MTIVTRPTTLAAVVEQGRRKAFPLMAESTEYGKGYQAQPTDLFISPYPKCGTTWLQQIVHGLKTRGDMSFDDISQVVPWLEMAQFHEIDLYAPQPGGFHAFKSHLAWYDIPKGGRYIVSFRNLKDVLVSNYHFFDGWIWQRGSITLAEYVRLEDGGRDMYLNSEEPGDYFHHLCSWWEQRDNPSVLLLAYENMKQDLAGSVRRIAEFLKLEADPDLLTLVTHQASVDFMQAHADKFDDHMMRDALVKHGMLPPGDAAPRVRKGDVGAHRDELPADVANQVDELWHRVIEARFGLPSYEALRDELAQRC
ncbi:sulfotransferase domain-containing protein [bacterium]|nr:sulfotransferase domain-containing protein [bacterium]